MGSAPWSSAETPPATNGPPAAPIQEQPLDLLHPANPQAAFGSPSTFGTSNDPMVGKLVGGTIVFGGGLPLYGRDGKIIGGLGLSGDTSCTDHIIAWKIRHMLHLDAVAMGPSRSHKHNMILDFKNGGSLSGFGHPDCKGGMDPSYIIQSLSQKFPTGASKSQH